MRVVYRCEFQFLGNRMSVFSNEGLSDFTSGFWLNWDMKFTKGSDGHIWIPPHNIYYIAKDIREE